MRLALLLLVAGALLVATSVSAEDEARLRARALAIHRRALVVDTHNDVTSPIVDKGFDLGQPAGKGHTDLARLRAGGIGAQFFAVYVAPSYAEKGALRRTMEMIDAVQTQVERHGKHLELARSVDDIRRIRRRGKIAALMGIEGGHAIEDSLAALRVLYRLGVRYMTLTHSESNSLGDSSTDAPKHGGLSPFGKQVVTEMNRLGMMIDVSHVADTTIRDVLAISTAPVIASHSSARALCNVPRNLPDDLLRAIARKGGVVMVNFGSYFIDEPTCRHGSEARKVLRPRIAELRKRTPPDKARAEIELLWKKWDEEHPAPPRPKLGKLVDHIEHVIRVAGEDAVGLGSDFDGVGSVPEGLDDVSRMPEITVELVRRGHAEKRIRKILGANLLRVMREVELRAARPRG